MMLGLKGLTFDYLLNPPQRGLFQSDELRFFIFLECFIGISFLLYLAYKYYKEIETIKINNIITYGK